MRITTNSGSRQQQFLLRFAIFAAALAAFCTFILIWSFRSLEIDDLVEEAKARHETIALALRKDPNLFSLEEIANDQSARKRAFQSLSSMLAFRPLACAGIAYKDQLILFSPNCPNDPFSAAGPANGAASGVPLPSYSLGLVEEHNGAAFYSEYSFPNSPNSSSAKIILRTDETADFLRIGRRSRQIALAGIAVESLLLLALVLIARKGEKLLVESHKENQAMESELFFLSHYDTITHLPNRTLFWEHLDAALSRAKRLKKGVGIFLYDIPRFSKINDEFGRSIGDALLREVAARLQSAARSSDLTARLEADQFAIILEDLDAAGACEAQTRVADRLRKALRDPFSSPELADVRFKSAIGAALFPEDGEDAEALLVSAKNRCKTAKKNLESSSSDFCVIFAPGSGEAPSA